MPLLYGSGTVDPLSIISGANTVFTHTITANGRVGVSLLLSSLHTDAATITMTCELLDGSDNVFGTITEVFTKPSSATRLWIEMERTVFRPSGHKARVKLASTGSGNSAISCAWYLFDPNYASDVGAMSSAALDSIADAVWDESWLDHYENTDSFAEFLAIVASVAGDAAYYSEQVLEDTGTTGVVLASAHDVYHADIDVALDLLDTKDEYTITWFKNGVRLTGSGSSSTPSLQAVKRDGNNLLSVTPSAIGTTGSYKHTEETARLTPGEAVIVVASAVIDSATRSFARLVSRDKPA